MEVSEVQTLIEQYTQRSEEQQLRILCRLSFYLTIGARTYYSVDTQLDNALNAMEIFNELQHSITGQILQLLDGSNKRYPDDVFINILVETSSCLHTHLWWCFNRALDMVNPDEDVQSNPR